MTECKYIKSSQEVYIKVTKDGPYLVYGAPILKQEFIKPNSEGASWDYKEGKKFKVENDGKPVALCRCGKSKHAPFCDSTHKKAHFDGTETADHKPAQEGAEVFEGPAYTLLDNEVYCAFARFCEAYGKAWNLVEDESKEANELAVREVCNCPAGRLMIKKNGTDEIIEPKLDKEISVLEDIGISCSAGLFVKGKIRIEGADGKVYEIRNRQALCRCGNSANKPFCDGTHARLKYQDGIK